MRYFKTLLLGLSLLTVEKFAKANFEKPVDIRLHGYVTDAVTKKPVSGVTVLATAPGVAGTTGATTDADGYFSFGQLPGQQVNLQFGKKGYQSYRKTNVSVKEKTPLKLMVEFIPEIKDEEPDQTEYPVLRMLQFSR